MWFHPNSWLLFMKTNGLSGVSKMFHCWTTHLTKMLLKKKDHFDPHIRVFSFIQKIVVLKPPPSIYTNIMTNGFIPFLKETSIRPNFFLTPSSWWGGCNTRHLSNLGDPKVGLPKLSHKKKTTALRNGEKIGILKFPWFMCSNPH